MPIIKANLFVGHTRGVKTRLANLLTDAYRSVLPVPPASITIVLEEMERENYMRGGAMRRRVEPLPDPVSVINGYVAAFRSGDFDKVCDFLTEDCRYVLPGGVTFDRPEDARAWMAGRTPQVESHGRSIETAYGDHGPIVYVRALLSGRRVDGTEFENQRSVTRYEFRGGKIASLNLWHDLPAVDPKP